MTMRGLPILKNRAVTVLRFAGWAEEDINTVFCSSDDRAETMKRLYREGMTLEFIGAKFRVSRERVRQIIRAGNVDRVEGGRSLAVASRAEKASQRKDDTCLRKHGCTRAQYQMLLSLQRGAEQKNRGPIRAFQQQKNAAHNRHIQFNLKLWEWWTIWQESGKWEQRGRNSGCYVMSRIADEGAYEVGNVCIVTVSENIAESYEVNPASNRCGVAFKDELGLTRAQRRIYDHLHISSSPSKLATILNLNRSTVSQQLVHIRRVRPELVAAQ